jgi:CRISPR-associated protein Csm5
MNVHAGPPRAMTRLTLRLVPLTPVHVGDGTSLWPDEYVIETAHAAAPFDDEDHPRGQRATPTLCRFDQTRAMRAMTLDQRSALSRALDSARLGEAAQVLRKAGKQCVTERIPVSTASAAELRKAMDDPRARSGEVKPFMRSGERPFVPGSSIKGALRTALASAALPREARAADRWIHDAAMQAAFGLDPNDTSTDPLRFLHVGDAFLPDGATLIDKAEVVKRGGDPAAAPGGGGGIQMHFERTRALTDGPQAPAFTVTLGWDARALDERCITRSEARFDVRAVLRQSLAFHVKLFNTEVGLFFEAGTKPLLLRLLRAHQSPDGATPITAQGWSSGFVLLRLGRFGHFESKSLEGVRRGHFPQAKNPADRIRQPGAWGTTRTITRDANGNPIPFGWVIGWVVKEERA